MYIQLNLGSRDKSKSLPEILNYWYLSVKRVTQSNENV